MHEIVPYLFPPLLILSSSPSQGNFGWSLTPTKQGFDYFNFKKEIYWLIILER